jgi:ribosomal protein S18 acetylase RimI-like enzyme
MVPEDRRAIVAPFGRLRTPEAIHIMSIYIDPDYRGQGVGKTMMLEAELLEHFARNVTRRDSPGF